MSRKDIENRYRRKRYATDPEYRAKVLAAQALRKEQRNTRKRHRYRMDEAYRQARIAHTRAYRNRVAD